VIGVEGRLWELWGGCGEAGEWDDAGCGAGFCIVRVAR